MITKYSQLRLFSLYSAFICLLALGTTALLPFSTIAFELSKLIVFSLLAIVCCLILLRDRAEILGLIMRTSAGKFLLLFIAVTVISFGWSSAPIISVFGSAPRFTGIFFFAVCFSVLFSALHLAQDEQGRRTLLNAICLSNAIIVLHAVMQIAGADPLDVFFIREAFLGRAFGLLGHPNTLGQFIVLTVPFVALRFRNIRGQEWPLFWGLLVLCNILVLLATVSRSSMFGLVVMIAFCLPWMRPRTLRQAQEKLGALMRPRMAVFVTVLIVVFVSVSSSFFSDRFALSYERGRSINAREILWTASLDMIKERPQGYGLGTIGILSPKFMSADIYQFEPLTSGMDRAHNIFLDLWLTLGPLALFFFIAFLGSLFAGALKHHNQDKTGFIAASALSLVGFTICILFGFPSIATWIFFWLIVGILLSMLPSKAAGVAPVYSRIVVVIFLILSVLSFTTSLQWSRARISREQALHAAAEGQNLNAFLLHTKSVDQFTYDHHALQDAAESGLRVLENLDQPSEGFASIEDVVTNHIRSLSDLSGAANGNVPILKAWLAAIHDEAEEVTKFLNDAERLLASNINFHRAAMHIYDVFGDTTKKQHHADALKDLVPDAFYENEDMQRILLKQHPWLEEVVSQ